MQINDFYQPLAAWSWDGLKSCCSSSLLGTFSFLPAALRHGQGMDWIVPLLGHLAFCAIFIIFRASRIFGICKICKNFRISRISIFSDFSQFQEFSKIFQVFRFFTDTFSIFIGFSCFCSSSFNFTSGPGITWLRLVVCKTWFYLFKRNDI